MAGPRLGVLRTGYMRRARARCASPHAENDAPHPRHRGARRRARCRPPRTPTLKARAILPADATWPAPFPAAPNTEPAPAPGSIQPVGGFSALLKGPHGSYLAMPDNGFGTKANSRSLPPAGLRGQADLRPTRRATARAILERDHAARPRPQDPVPARQREHARSASSPAATSTSSRSHRPPRHAVVRRRVRPLPAPHRRHRQGARGADPAARRALARLPADYPPLGARPNLALLQRLRGHGDLARRPHALPDARGPAGRRRPDKTIRRSYHVRHRPAPLRAGLPRLPRRGPELLSSPTSPRSDSQRFVSLERDNFQGPRGRAQAGVRWSTAGPRRAGQARGRSTSSTSPTRRDLAAGPVRPGDFGLGDPFKMPYQTIEAVLPLGGDELAIVNDTNFGSTGRNPALPDYSDFIRVRVPGSSSQRLKLDQPPQLPRVVLAAGDVLVDQPRDRRGVEVALGAQRARRRGPRGQNGSSSPRSQAAAGIEKPFLRPRAISRPTSGSTAERSRRFLAKPRTRAAGGSASASSATLRVEERHAQLERVGHAHAVGLHQQVVDEVDRAVDVLQPRERVGALGLRPAGAVDVERVDACRAGRGAAARRARRARRSPSSRGGARAAAGARRA